MKVIQNTNNQYFIMAEIMNEIYYIKLALFCICFGLVTDINP